MTASAVQRRFNEETAPASALKLQTAERLAAHRSRRAESASKGLFDTPIHTVDLDSRAGRIAAAVAERYAHSQSYRAFLAAEAERAHTEAERARAAAEVARRTAEAVAAVQLQLLQELEVLADQERATVLEDHAVLSPSVIPETAHRPAAVTVRLYEVPAPGDLSHAVANAVPYARLEEEDRMALDEEIAFRQAPVFEDFQQAAVPLSANLIEFPRHLVASRKARPRLAEGPLREEQERSGNESQLRIFEVEPELISTVASADSALPEWSSIRLDACIVTEPLQEAEYPVNYRHRPLTAPMGLRLMATLVDGCLLAAALLAFISAEAYLAGEVPLGPVGAISAAGTLGFLGLLYYGFFFTFSDATPGMRYARIGFCTLEDENPTRRSIRRRLVAMLLAACPFGLGFLWAFIDDDGLGWHDRMSGMYPRSY